MSEIFDEYVKIAMSKGLLKTAEDKSKEKVYGLKPETLKEMDYKNNIMEIAHPNKVVIAPAYDALNGLVENNIEQHNIFLNIVNRPVSGQVNLYKNAQSELASTLVCIGTQQDLKNNRELSDLADACLKQLSEKNKKTAGVEAAAPVGLLALSNPYTAIALGVAVLGGAIYWHYHAGPQVEAYKEACDNAIKQIDDVLQSTFTTYKEVFYKKLNIVKDQIIKSKQAFSEYDSAVDKLDMDLLDVDLESEEGKNKIIQLASSPTSTKIQTLLANFKKELNKTQRHAFSISQQTSSKQAQENLVESRSLIQGIGKKFDDLTGNIFFGGNGLIANDLDDINIALATLIKSGNNIVETYKGGKEFGAKTSEETKKHYEDLAAKEAAEKAANEGPKADGPATDPATKPVEEKNVYFAD